MVRNHSLHRDAADERARLAQLAKVNQEWIEHEQALRARERRRILATLTVEQTVEDPDFPGCVW
jgi:hypothetical protein